MEDDYKDVNESQEGAEDLEEEELESETEEGEKGEPAKHQSAEDNAKFASFRRETEAAKAEAAKLRKQTDALLMALDGFGYEGTPEEIADMLISAQNNVSVEEARAARTKKEERDAELEEMRNENKRLKDIAIQKLMDDDLAKIQEVYPEVKTLESLGNAFFEVLKVTKDAVLSYEIISARKNTSKKQSSAETKDHFVKTGGQTGTSHEKEIPASELSIWKETFANDTPAQLRTRYNRALKRQEGA